MPVMTGGTSWAMDASTEPQTPEEAAALRALAVTHHRRHRWVALCCRLCVSVHTTVILHTVWRDWLLNARDLVGFAFLVVHACVGLGLLGWSLRALRRDEALGRQETRLKVRWRAQDRAWRERWPERTSPLGGGRA
jgi:hypothetical protein